MRAALPLHQRVPTIGHRSSAAAAPVTVSPVPAYRCRRCKHVVLAAGGDVVDPKALAQSGRDNSSIPAPAGRAPLSRPAGSAAADTPAGFQVPLGVTALVLLNCALFAAAISKSNAAINLAINPYAVKWWSFLTSAFVHQNLDQLWRNMFIVFFFSQMVYRELGAFGVWFAYVLGGLGANLSSWWLLAASAKAKAAAMLGLASSGGALAICLSAVALSFRPNLGYLLGAFLTLKFVASFMLTTPVTAAAAAAAKPVYGTATEAVTGALRDPVGVAVSAVKGMKTSALDPGNIWAVGAVVAAVVVVVMAQLPDSDGGR